MHIHVHAHAHNPTNLYVFCESSEHLLCYPEWGQEGIPGWVANTLVISMVPVEVSNGLLQSEQVVHCSHYNVHCGCVTLLSMQLVLKLQKKNGKKYVLIRMKSELVSEKEEEKAVKKKMEKKEMEKEEEKKK